MFKNQYKIQFNNRKEFEGIAQSTWFKIWKYEAYFKIGGKCPFCGIKMRYPKSNQITFGDDLATVDHIIDLSFGGKNEKSNFQIICFKCNADKNFHTHRIERAKSKLEAFSRLETIETEWKRRVLNFPYAKIALIKRLYGGA